MITKKELDTLKKDIKNIQKKIDTYAKAIEKIETAKAPKVSKAKAVKATLAKKASKAPAIKKSKGITDTDKVLNIIKRSKKGVDAPTLVKKTGFNDKKIRNMLFRANKEGKIKKAGRGVYVGAE